MSIRMQYGIGPLSVTVNWLDKCPKCNSAEAKVTGWSVTSENLWAGDKVICTKCGHKGEVDADGDNAWVEWDAIKERAA